MRVCRGRVLVRLRAMGVRGGRMLLGFIVLAYAMMMSGGLMMML